MTTSTTNDITARAKHSVAEGQDRPRGQISVDELERLAGRRPSRVNPEPSYVPAGSGDGTLTPALQGRNLVVKYGPKAIINGLDVTIPQGELTVIVGPNACGKSTLLRSLCRVLPLAGGTVDLLGQPLASMETKAAARTMSLLPQSPTAPEGTGVEELVARGRYPHQNVFGSWRAEDEEAVKMAMDQAGVTELAERRLDELSGGQRQRVWLAMVLAQDTPVVLMDEPTTYLDITHQLEVLNIARDLQQRGRSVVVVLHELSLAFRYATHLIVMKAGNIIAQGDVRDVVTAELLREVYDLECIIIPDPLTGRPIIVPR